MGHASYYVAANHEAASKFIGQGNLSAKYSAGDLAEPLCFEAKQLYGHLLADPVQWRLTGGCLSRETDEESCICNSPDRIARMGANAIVTQERDRPCRQLCTDWPDGRRQTGLFDEVREFAGAADPATAGSNQGGARAGS
jgi:hypothetical protein